MVFGADLFMLYVRVVNTQLKTKALDSVRQTDIPNAATER